jgi:hypothetical protein
VRVIQSRGGLELHYDPVAHQEISNVGPDVFVLVADWIALLRLYGESSKAKLFHQRIPIDGLEKSVSQPIGDRERGSDDPLC